MSNTAIALTLGGFVGCYVFVVLGLVARAIYFPKSANEIPDFHYNSRSYGCKLESDRNPDFTHFESEDGEAGAFRYWSSGGGYCPDGMVDEDGNMATH